jgi:hypothetical protein
MIVSPTHTQIVGDGNCQFRAVADQLYGDEKDHELAREVAVSWLAENENFEVAPGIHLVDFMYDQPSWDSYCDEMRHEGSWGDELKLIAMAEHFKVRFWILSSSNCADEQATIVIEPRQGRVRKNVYLLHWLERGHYDSLTPHAN